MNDVVPALLVALLVCAAPAMAVAPAGPADAAGAQVDAVQADHDEHDGTTNRLAVDGRTTYASPSPDLGATLASQDESIAREFHTYGFERTLEAVENDTADRETVAAATAWVEARIDAMTAREREIVERHADGDATDAAVLRTLARNYDDARNLERAVERLDARADDVSGADVPVQAYDAELETFTSPLRGQLRETIRASGDDARSLAATTTLETSGEGLVVSTIEGDRYVREAVRYDNRNRSRTDQFEGLTDAYETAEAAYPWAFEHRESVSVNSHTPTSLYRIQVPHEQGDLTAYLDSGTRSVYYEYQTLRLDRLPTVSNETVENGSLAATVERTPADGPVAVTVTDAESGDPLEATVAVDGTVLGETDANGELWLVPPDAAFELTVESGDETLNATVG